MFLTSADFDVLPYNLPNTDNAGFQDYVDEHEKHILTYLMGPAMYDQLIAGKEASEQKWMDIVNGKAYQISEEHSYRWGGLKQMLKPYIYAMWLRDTFDAVTSAGVQVAKVENATIIRPTDRIVRAYNVFAMLAGTRKSVIDSLYGFVAVNSTEYPSFKWKDPGTMNTFNL
jgi:hypothetical protein